MSTTINWSYFPVLPDDPDPVDPSMAFLPGKPDVWHHWWGQAYLGHIAQAKCTRIRILDGEAIMRLRWYDSIDREVKQKTIRWSMPHDLARCRVPLIERVRIEMRSFKSDLFATIKHHFN
jgi:hypothetical protein